jgi:hypothetical protein
MKSWTLDQGKGISKSVTNRISGKSLSTGLAHFLGEQMRSRPTFYFSLTIAFGVDILGGGATRFAAAGKGRYTKANSEDTQNNEGGAGFHGFEFLRTQIRNKRAI